MAILRNEFRHVFTSTATEDNEIHQRICAETISAMHRDAGYFASSIETWEWRPLGINDDTSIYIGRNTTHSIVSRGLYRHWLGNRLNTEVVSREVCNVWQLFGNNFFPQVPYIQVQIVFAVYATPLFDLLNHFA